MFEIIVRCTDGHWIDLSGVPDVELFKAFSDWSSGKEEEIKIKSFTFKAAEISQIVVNR